MDENNPILWDLHGIRNSGKSLLRDLLSHHKDVFTFENHLEFDLFRASGGLNDLFYAMKNLSFVERDVSIKRFNRLVSIIGTKARLLSPYSCFRSSGHNYNDLFKGEFFNICNEFTKSLVKDSFHCDWPFDLFYESGYSRFKKRVKRNILKRSVNVRVNNTESMDISRLIYKLICSLTRLLSGSDCKHIVLNNAFFSIDLANSYDKFKSICVVRDPRDIYLCAKKFLGSRNKRHNKSDFNAVNNIDAYIRGKQADFLFEKRNTNNIIYFERIAHNCSDEIRKLNQMFDFNFQELGYDMSRSKKNIGLWLSHKTDPNIIKIQQALAEYCLPESLYQGTNNDK